MPTEIHVGTEREGHACRVRQWNADAAHAQFWQRPMGLRRPEYRATPQSAFAKVQDGTRRIHRVRRDGRACRDPRARLLWWNQIMGVGFICFFWYVIAPAMKGVDKLR